MQSSSAQKLSQAQRKHNCNSGKGRGKGKLPQIPPSFSPCTFLLPLLGSSGPPGGLKATTDMESVPCLSGVQQGSPRKTPSTLNTANSVCCFSTGCNSHSSNGSTSDPSLSLRVLRVQPGSPQQLPALTWCQGRAAIFIIPEQLIKVLRNSPAGAKTPVAPSVQR